MIPSGLRIDPDTAAPVILLLVADDPKSEFRGDQFTRDCCSRETRQAADLGKGETHEISGTQGVPGTMAVEHHFLKGLVQTPDLENDMTNQNNPSGQKDQQQKHQNQPQSGQQKDQQQRQGGQQDRDQQSGKPSDQQNKQR
jgi:hypothetical protein